MPEQQQGAVIDDHEESGADRVAHTVGPDGVGRVQGDQSGFERHPTAQTDHVGYHLGREGERVGERVVRGDGEGREDDKRVRDNPHMPAR